MINAKNDKNMEDLQDLKKFYIYAKFLKFRPNSKELLLDIEKLNELTTCESLNDDTLTFEDITTNLLISSLNTKTEFLLKLNEKNKIKIKENKLHFDPKTLWLAECLFIKQHINKTNLKMQKLCGLKQKAPIYNQKKIENILNKCVVYKNNNLSF